MEKIHKLIEELEKEQADLKRLIDEAVKNGEYLIAHFHSEAIGYVNRRLQTFRNLDDKMFDSKRMIERMIESCELQLGLDHPLKFREYLLKERDKLEHELRELVQEEKLSVSESYILVGHLDSLLMGQIRCVKIVIKKSSNFILDIRRYRAGIKLQIPNLNSLRKDYTIHEDRLVHFYGLGFTLNGTKSKLTLVLPKREKDYLLMQLQNIISRIVFEIFYFKEFDGDSYVEIGS